MDEKKEIRNTAYQVQVTGESEEKRTVEGYAVLFNTPSDGLYFEEVIERGALDGEKRCFCVAESLPKSWYFG